MLVRYLLIRLSIRWAPFYTRGAPAAPSFGTALNHQNMEPMRNALNCEPTRIGSSPWEELCLVEVIGRMPEWRLFSLRLSELTDVPELPQGLPADDVVPTIARAREAMPLVEAPRPVVPFEDPEEHVGESLLPQLAQNGLE